MLSNSRVISTLKNWDNYRWATLLTWPLTTALLVFLIVHGGFLRPEWFLDLMMVPALVSGLQSGTTYLARIIDGCTVEDKARRLRVKTLFNSHATTDRRAGTGEIIGMAFGAVLGITVATLLIVGHETIPLLKPLHQFADCLFAMASLGIYAGLVGRIGSLFDRDASGFDNYRKIGMAIVAVVGIGLGIALFITGAATLISIVGVTNFFSGGAALPLWIMGFIFVAGFTNTLVSCTDYVIKTAYFLKFVFSGGSTTFREKMQARLHEYRGAMVGITVGSCLAGIIIISLVITQPHLIVGAIGLALAGMCVVACANSMGSLCSKLGRMLDGFGQPKLSSAIVEDQITEPFTLQPAKVPAPGITQSSHYMQIVTRLGHYIPCWPRNKVVEIEPGIQAAKSESNQEQSEPNASNNEEKFIQRLRKIL